LEEIVLAREELRELAARASTLTPLERRSILAIVNGDNPHRDGGDKSVDNATQRARRKLRPPGESTS
jgi:hypothetical protein